ncbi:hypothetical protein [Novosphingobium sp.]|uniref:hypothetical protein n=1 Tax=Novosphingobium sp. TaxID=1874826 RepID=UPI00286D075F|nr:hypothetical protein [Novosphingobium sp.]
MGGYGLKTLVLITGIISAVVWMAPSLVTIGLFLLVVPGLILMIMPTVFVYLLATLLIRAVLPLQSWPATAAALAIVVALGFILPQPLRLIHKAQYDSAMQPEIVPGDPVRLAGEVLVINKKPSHDGALGGPACDALCAALLASPGVTGVTIRNEAADADDPRQKHFRLDPGKAGGSAGPNKPEDIVGHLPELREPHKKGEPLPARSDRQQALRQAVISDWTIRLATSAGLSETQTAPAADFTITITANNRAHWNPNVDRLEVARTGQPPLLRRSLVRQRALAAPFHFGFEGMIENAHFVIGYSMLTSAPIYPDFDPLLELLRHTSLAQAIPDVAQSGALRSAVIAALDKPSASQAQLNLAKGWMDSLEYKPAPEDLALVHRVIADQRITGIRTQVNRFYQKAIPPELRAPLVARILNPASDPQERSAYGKLLSKLPEGTFAQPTGDEARILADPVLRRQAAPFIERLADQSQPGLAMLMQILENEIASGTQWAIQRPVIRAVRRGLARLGPGAASALPRIEELFARPRNPLANLSQEADEWRFTMARMGKPVDALPFTSGQKPESLERDKAQIRKRLADFDPAWESGYSY